MTARLLLVAIWLAVCAFEAFALEPRGTGDLAIVIERAQGAVAICETTARTQLARVTGFGDLSHASAVFSRDGRYAYIFGRDGALTKLDLLTHAIVKRVLQAGNSIGGAISSDGALVAVANYVPGGVKVFDAATLDVVADVPSTAGADGVRAKVVGLEDGFGRRFMWSEFENGRVRMLDLAAADTPRVSELGYAGRQPYDALVTPDGRDYIAGLFGEDGLVRVDLWAREPTVARFLAGYGGSELRLPVYKMPHLEGWSAAGEQLFLPAVGHHAVLVVDRRDWREIGRIATHGQPVFAVARPDGRQVWVNFAPPDNDIVQVIDVPSRTVIAEFSPGKAVLHIEFTPRGEQAWVSARDSDRVVVYDSASFARLAELAIDKPSGIFMSARAARLGF